MTAPKPNSTRQRVLHDLAQRIEANLGIPLYPIPRRRIAGYDLATTPDPVTGHPEPAQSPIVRALDRLAIRVAWGAKETDGQLACTWESTVEAALDADRLPVLAYRGSRPPWRFLVPMVVINPRHQPWYDLELSATLRLPGFCAAVRGLAFGFPPGLSESVRSSLYLREELER